MIKTKKKKSLGQNFLQDMEVVDEIIATADIQPGDVVIEVGPGDGALTAQLLAAGAQVFAVEIDQDLIPALENRFGGDEKCTILNADIRRFNIPAFLADHNIASYKVVANLPYYITSSIVRLFLESSTKPTEMVIMVQKEVAERICAEVGAMSILAVAVQFYGVPQYVLTVRATAFSPVPQVDSAVIYIDQIAQPLTTEEEKYFFRIVKAGFSARRKKLINNLANSLHLEKKEVEQIVKSLGLKSTVRAQELTMEQWQDLAQRLHI